ncbi:MAG: hypothetical protein CVU54_06565 [Deltaproteobacteria bacterium HGW-Deltaproteobacteria-12]|jgi:hypothetical protein|nr:MAG: hypothetical protein CVU54_06565 [Deltaproteobacteria bacterium HGW-Deltaproteobacteria-12]
MQAEITFSENTLGTKAADHPKIFPIVKQVQRLNKCIAKSDWDKKLAVCEKFINRFSWGIIIAAVIYLTPVCINIILR